MRRLPPEIDSAPTRKQRRARRGQGRGRRLPLPARSARLYIYVHPSEVHLFRYFLEARDNLGLMTVVDRWRAALMVRYSPHQEREMRAFLEEVRADLDFTLVAAIPHPAESPN